jgi:hypothetical protein
VETDCVKMGFRLVQVLVAPHTHSRFVEVFMYRCPTVQFPAASAVPELNCGVVAVSTESVRNPVVGLSLADNPTPGVTVDA